MNKERAEEIVVNYGLCVSAIHDPRHYDADEARLAKATPNTCNGEEKEALIFLYGEKWREEFWGEDYYEVFPEQK